MGIAWESPGAALADRDQPTRAASDMRRPRPT